MKKIIARKILLSTMLIVLIATTSSFSLTGVCDSFCLVDPLLIDTLSSLDCPYWISDEIVNCVGHTGNIGTINESGLVCKQSLAVNEHLVETYQGETDDYIIIVRDGDTVLCAQYINAQTPDEETSIEDLRQRAFFHQNTYFHGGLYVHYETAYFSNDMICIAIYLSLNQSTPDLVQWKKSNSISYYFGSELHSNVPVQ